VLLSRTLVHGSWFTAECPNYPSPRLPALSFYSTVDPVLVRTRTTGPRRSGRGASPAVALGRTMISERCQLVQLGQLVRFCKKSARNQPALIPSPVIMQGPNGRKMKPFQALFNGYLRASSIEWCTRLAGKAPRSTQGSSRLAVQVLPSSRPLLPMVTRRTCLAPQDFILQFDRQ
jgi:hypothetical protein